MERGRWVRRGVGWGMVAVFVASIVTWGVTRDRLPRQIRIATALPGGLYYRFAELLQPGLADRTGRAVTLLQTEGTPDNRGRLLRGEAELAVMQAGPTSMDGLITLAPLYHDVLLVVARTRAGLESVCDLLGHRVAIGMPESGMHATAEALLEQYRIARDRLEVVDAYFLDLLSDETLDAAIITTGLANPDLERLLNTGDFRILPVHEAEAFALRHPAYRPFSVPRGAYGATLPVPPDPIPTVATTALLVARNDVSPRLTDAAIHALYESNVRVRVPTLISPIEAARWDYLPLHPEARRYFDPYQGIDTLASFMESLAAGKELLFAFCAGLYLAWDRWRRVRQRRHDRTVRAMKERLDDLLFETARIERAQMETKDHARLKAYLDNVTGIKLRALEELTHEDLRGDRMFLIFLLQCGNLINKIQAKILSETSSEPGRPGTPV